MNAPLLILINIIIPVSFVKIKMRRIKKPQKMLFLSILHTMKKKSST